MRGKLGYSFFNNVGKRITPAGAGKTISRLHVLSFLQDHPRRCGENQSFTRLRKHRLGSPPQVRGKLRCAVNTAVDCGITPAGAGKTIFSFFHPIHNQDHPRRCGENPTTKRAYRRTLGSPPQVRGKPVSAGGLGMTFRITPAGAGKTQHGLRGGWGSEDHPRRCGENMRGNCRYTRLTGSPPQVRGKQNVP